MTGNVRRDNEKSKGEEPIKKQLEEVCQWDFPCISILVFLLNYNTWFSPVILVRTNAGEWVPDADRPVCRLSCLRVHGWLYGALPALWQN